ncbi:MAG TPA: restriction endonuclease subunit S [Blastocatellia bacterium]|nr:restriction endonuclease subunit S [Blastocatellia bacterium]
MNWKTLKLEEFDLPPLDQQRRIVEILWAVDNLITSETKAKNAIDTVLQQQIDQTMNVDATRPTSSNGVTLQAVTTKIVDGVHKRPDYTPTGIPFLTVENLTRGPQIDFQQTRFVSAADHSEFMKRAHPEQGDVLVTKDGTLGVARYVDTNTPFSIFVSLALLKPKRELVSGRFLEYYIRSATFAEHVRKRVSGSALKHIHLIDFRSAPFHLIPLEEQIGRVERFQVLEAASAALKRTLDAISRVRDSLIAHLT